MKRPNETDDWREQMKLTMMRTNRNESKWHGCDRKRRRNIQCFYFFLPLSSSRQVWAFIEIMTVVLLHPPSPLIQCSFAEWSAANLYHALLVLMFALFIYAFGNNRGFLLHNTLVQFLSANLLSWEKSLPANKLISTIQMRQRWGHRVAGSC